MRKIFLPFIITVGIVAVLFTVHVFVTNAQSATIDLTLSSIPINPKPGDQIVVSAQSYATDLTQDNTTWTYNGKTIASGIGITQVTVMAPGSGVTGILVLTVSGTGFSVASTSLSFLPGSVDLLWEGADSYTPPFYKGRALPSVGGVVRVTAVPTITAPKNVSYRWSQNSSALPNSSGYNKSSLLFQNDPLTPTEHIDVTATSGTFSGEDSIDITPGSPALVAYFSNDGFTDYANGSTNTLTTGNPGTIIHFEPFYFSAPHNINKDLNFTYTDSTGNNLTASSLKNELRLSSPDGGGSAQFNVDITTTKYSLQNLNHLFNINFL